MNCLALVLALAAVAQCAELNPVGKVLELLHNLHEKVTSEEADAEKEHTKYREWCRSTVQDLEHSISRNKDKIEEASAIIKKADGDVESYSSDIADLASKIQKDEEDLSEASKVRKHQFTHFEKTQKDLEETIDTIVRAMGILRKAGLGFPQLKEAVTKVVATLSLLMDAESIDDSDRARLSSLIQSTDSKDDDDEDDAEEEGSKFQNPKAARYESHSKNIIEMVEQLKVKANDELSDLRKKEMEEAHSFEMLKQSLTDSVVTGERDRKKKQAELSEAKEDKGTSQGHLAEQSADLSKNDDTLKTTHESCDSEAEDYDHEVKSRSDELGALKKAIEILSNPKFASSVSARLDFVQLTQVDHARQNAAAVIRGIARKFRNVQLAQLAMVAERDPFGKVMGMIKEMMIRLKKQAAEEATQHAFCVKEKDENEKKRDDITDKRNDFDARLQKANADEAKTKEEIADLSEDLAELEKKMIEANEMRHEESADFAKSSEESRIAKDGLEKAMKVLREYYAAKGDHDKAGDSASGIIAMLETAEADTSNKQAEAELKEKNAASHHAKMVQTAAVNKAQMEASSKAKEGELTRLKEAMADLKNDVEGAEQELDAVMKYLDKLRGQCEHKPMTFAERAAKRQEEIAGLKQALHILDTETSGAEEGFLQRKF